MNKRHPVSKRIVGLLGRPSNAPGLLKLGERATMNARDFGNFSQWPLKELIEKERSFTVGDLRGAEIKAEIDRRLVQRNQRRLLTSTIAAAASAIGSMIAAIVSLISLYLTLPHPK
jgi:hypothetical protein